MSVANDAKKEIEDSIIKLEAKVKQEQLDLYERIKGEMERDTRMVMSKVNNIVNFLNVKS